METDDIQCYDENQAEQDIAFMRRTVYKTTLEQTFAEKLKNTRAYRQKLCADENVNVKEKFPYFFTNTDLVSL